MRICYPASDLVLLCQRSSCATICEGGIRDEMSRELLAVEEHFRAVPAAPPTSLVIFVCHPSASHLSLLPRTSLFASSEGCADFASVPRLPRDGSSDCTGVLRLCRPWPRIPRQPTRGCTSQLATPSSAPSCRIQLRAQHELFEYSIF